MEDETLRSQLAAQLENYLVQKMLQEQVLTNPSLTFLQARDFAIRWIDTEGICNKSAHEFHFLATQRNVKNKEDTTE